MISIIHHTRPKWATNGPPSQNMLLFQKQSPAITADLASRPDANLYVKLKDSGQLPWGASNLWVLKSEYTFVLFFYYALNFSFFSPFGPNCEKKILIFLTREMIKQVWARDNHQPLAKQKGAEKNAKNGGGWQQFLSNKQAAATSNIYNGEKLPLRNPPLPTHQNPWQKGVGFRTDLYQKQKSKAKTAMSRRHVCNHRPNKLVVVGPMKRKIFDINNLYIGKSM